MNRFAAEHPELSENAREKLLAAELASRGIGPHGPGAPADKPRIKRLLVTDEFDNDYSHLFDDLFDLTVATVDLGNTILTTGEGEAGCDGPEGHELATTRSIGDILVEWMENQEACGGHIYSYEYEEVEEMYLLPFWDGVGTGVLILKEHDGMMPFTTIIEMLNMSYRVEYTDGSIA